MTKDPKIVYDADEFRALARYCDNRADIPDHFPCVAQVINHNGKGHCEDWRTVKVVQPPSDYSFAQKGIYLLGVIEGLEA